MSTDTVLINRHLQGDEQASRALVERYQEIVYGLAWRLLEDEEEAKDAAQEVFLRIFDALDRFRGECAFPTWVYRIAINGCIARSKYKKRRSATEVPMNEEKVQVRPLSANPPSSLELVERQERDTRLHQAIAKLAEPYRLVIVLCYFEGLAYEEIAQVLSVPLGTIKVRLFRAKQLLQRQLHIRSLDGDGRSNEMG